MDINKGDKHIIKFFIDDDVFMVECEYSGLKQTVNGVDYYQWRNVSSGKHYILSHAKLKVMIGDDFVDCPSFTI